MTGAGRHFAIQAVEDGPEKNGRYKWSSSREQLLIRTHPQMGENLCQIPKIAEIPVRNPQICGWVRHIEHKASHRIFSNAFRSQILWDSTHIPISDEKPWSNPQACGNFPLKSSHMWTACSTYEPGAFDPQYLANGASMRFGRFLPRWAKMPALGDCSLL